MAPFKSKSKSRSVRLNQTISNQPAHQREFPPLKVPAPFQGFVDFIREQGVVGLGVGFVIGTSANTLVKSIVTNMLNPFIGLFTGGIDLSQKVACLKTAAGVCKDPLNYGQVISDTITFIIILMVVYVVIKSLKLDKLDKKKT
ncbi:MAG TPA: MscL family protein [Candidatus Saccharimonadales bacterium]|jgi:large conductance mechanosensitive channel|nr:MscL family protein [Candidatus Saccharimonadales bacterium]